ncbi:thiol:disulfide interchange protein [Brevundimonas denitrificans]|uniref:Thiol:disulfide interchange protein n=1 Tax=Brevundimonas denitrificans TaxID=1443434 RepID=A0ABQ6BMC4_9CAUL|nr:TlpA disulfide reductase family protein [Brevundimonas denitrificans]GLS02431.1 thiol:disulfide interchange protein [Brevundimonas denitrificans]
MKGSKTAGIAIAGALAVGMVVGAGLLYANRDAFFKAATPEPAAKSALARFATGSLTRLETLEATPMAPDYVFKTRDGADATFAQFRGKVVVVNLWAMWCAPCRTEMPTLARLDEAYPDDQLMVLPINVDATPDGLADARSFIDVHEPLPLYSDMKFQLPFLLPQKDKMPQTVLLDRQGRIRASFAGEADWASPEARALIDALLAEPAA